MPRRSGDTNSKGEAVRHWRYKTWLLIITLVVAIGLPALAVAYGYGGLNVNVARIDARVDRIEKQVQDQLTNIITRLDDLFKLVGPSRRDNR